MKLVDADVDGVPTVWTSGEGALRAGLVFRVGRADEPFAHTGLTHLLEHAILAGAFPDGGEGHHNGAVGPTLTTFTIRGSADDLVDFYATVCRSLRDVPADRLDLEKAILRTEADGRSPGVGEALARWRA